MKSATIAAVLTVVLAGPALADDKCATAEKIARTAMEARQVGVPLVDMVQAAEGNRLLIEISKEAYRRPQYGTAEYQRQAINEFASEVYLICLEEN